MERSGPKCRKLFISMPRHRKPKTGTAKNDLDIQITTAKNLMRVLEDVFVTKRVFAFEIYHFVCRKQRGNELLEQFHADLVELASRVDCGDR